MEIENKVREIVCQQLDVDPEKVKLETSFIDDLGADSLAVVELVLALDLLGAVFSFYIGADDAEFSITHWNHLPP